MVGSDRSLLYFSCKAGSVPGKLDDWMRNKLQPTPTDIQSTEIGGAEAAIGQCACRKLRGALIFLPDADFGGEAELFAKAAFFKAGAHNDGLSLLWNQYAEKAFAGPPADSGEVIEGAAGGQEQSVKFCVLFGQELLLFALSVSRCFVWLY